jgi:hypothetical protein
MVRRARRLTGAIRRRTGAAGGVNPGNVVWIFGTGRTGSTWLAAMMGEIHGQAVWFEPRVGDLFDSRRFERYRGKHFILSPHYKKTWLNSMRTFVLDGANARFPEVEEGDYLVVKEPGGSGGARLLVEALPESRMVLLVRDPRDVVASWMDATKEGGWQYERKRERGRERVPSPGEAPNDIIKRHANAYLRHVGDAKKAYDSHAGNKVAIKYEDLRADTLGTMGRLYSTLGIVVEKHSWENIPEKEKGEGKFYRKAKPEGWREDLTPQQVAMVERITEPLLKEFYLA